MTNPDAPFDVLPYEDKEEWLALRGKGVGGSDVAAAMGLSKYKSPLSLWLEKTGRVEPEDLSGKEAVRWGVTLEPVIRETFAVNHDEYIVTKPDAIYCSKQYTWERASLDAELLEKSTGRMGVLEIKTAGEHVADDWKHGVPVYYQTQVTHYLNVTGYQFAWVAVLIGGQKYLEFRFDPDEEDRKTVREAVRDFWGFVERDEPPALIGHPDEGHALTAQFEHHSGVIRQYMTDDANRLIHQYASISEQVKELEERKRETANAIKQLIGDDYGITTDVYKVLWQRTQRKGYDYKRFEKEHPGMLEAYAQTKTVDMGIRVKELT